MFGSESRIKCLAALQNHEQTMLDETLINFVLASRCIPATQLRTDDFGAFY